ncbi:Uncharacterized protein TCM_018985 [Theobroma cacao]|uniref:Uncharacterized protein n=1 Tax=Theobroma cacao TaxID=3641 RepID=A0A061EFX3_THECC|nr:Uncharacterized protein TCM_018985 [Theobroma cacao]
MPCSHHPTHLSSCLLSRQAFWYDILFSLGTRKWKILLEIRGGIDQPLIFHFMHLKCSATKLLPETNITMTTTQSLYLSDNCKYTRYVAV